jgi:DNA mismatch repair protein MutS
MQDKRETLLALESELFQGACSSLKSNTINIIEMCKAIAELDLSTSVAVLSTDNGFVRPQLVEGGNSSVHVVKGGRHAVVETHQLGRGNAFIVNDAELSSESEMIWLLTGPNMGGKYSLNIRKINILTSMCVDFDNGTDRILRPL